MRRIHIALAFTAIPIIAVATYCLTWNDMRVSSLVKAADGNVFGLVKATGGERSFSEIRRWSEDLSQESVVNVGTSSIGDIDVSPAGDLLVADCRKGLRVVDLRSGKLLWTAKDDRHGSFHSLLNFVGDGAYVAAVKHDGLRKVDRVHIYRVADSALVGEIDEHSTNIYDIQSQKTRFAYLNWASELVVIELTGKVRERARVPDVQRFLFQEDGSILLRSKNETRVLDTNGAMTTAAPDAWKLARANTARLLRSAGRVKANGYGDLVVTDSRTGSSRTRRLQPIRRGDMLFILFLVSSAFAVWTITLLRDGGRRPRSWRAVTDLVMVCIVLHGMWSFSPRFASEFLPFFWFPVVGCLAFYGVLGLQNNATNWWLLVVGLLLFPLAPLVLLALLLRQFRWRLGPVRLEPSDKDPDTVPQTVATRQRQFTLRHVFLLITAIAAVLVLVKWLVATGWLFNFASFLTAGCVGLALLLGFSRLGVRVRWGLLAISAFLLAFASVGKFIGGRSATEPMFLCSIPVFFLMHLWVHGIVLSRIRVTPPPRDCP